MAAPVHAFQKSENWTSVGGASFRRGGRTAGGKHPNLGTLRTAGTVRIGEAGRVVIGAAAMTGVGSDVTIAIARMLLWFA